jgi:phage I-like protein
MGWQMLTLLGRIFGARPAGAEAHGLSNAIDLSADSKAPTEFRIFRAGVNTSDKGDFIFDEEAARLVMSAFAKKGTALTMDFEHMAAADPPVIAPASASSWVPEVRGGELWATNVHWTDKARQMIEAREYTRISPLFYSDPKTKRVLRILNVALTNVEALDNVQPLVAAAATTTGAVTMKMLACKTCAKALKAPTDDTDGDEVMCTACGALPRAASAIGLRADTAESDVLAALSGLAGFRATVLSLTGKATAHEAIGVISGWRGNDAEITRLRAENERVESERLKAEFNGLLDGAGKDGKLPPAERESLVALAVRGGSITKEAVELVKANLAARQKLVVVEGGGEGPKPKPTQLTAVTDADKQVAKLFGHDVKDVEKFKADAAAAQ